MPAVTIMGDGYEDTGCAVMARVYDATGTLLTQSTTTSVTVKVFDEDSDTPDTAIYSATLTVSAVIYDTLQTAYGWVADSTGFNLRVPLAASIFTLGCRNYSIEILVTPTAQDAFFVVAKRKTAPVRTS